MPYKESLNKLLAVQLPLKSNLMSKKLVEWKIKLEASETHGLRNKPLW